MNGIINVYKERGFTSHDVVAKLRGILHMKKIGHTGTLDPDATGVLPVCIGKATKVCGLLTDKDKTYRAVVKLGVMTNTEDMTGEILAKSSSGNGQIRYGADVINRIIGYSSIPYTSFTIFTKRSVLLTSDNSYYIPG